MSETIDQNTATKKFCVNCRHYPRDDASPPRCSSPRNLTRARFDLVTGISTEFPPATCASLRENGLDASLCGEDAAWFEDSATDRMTDKLQRAFANYAYDLPLNEALIYRNRAGLARAALETMRVPDERMRLRCNELEAIYKKELKSSEISGFCWLVYCAMIEEALK